MENMTFEQSMLRLEKIIEKLENQETSLEDAMKLFQEGVGLSEECAQQLENAKQSVKILIEKNGKMQEEEFSPDAD